ncbi:MAG: hypothetical protein Q4F02_02475 [Candidatus Saccharibacteria bacterium]|nr:hypothetical protein [Candidatus Saccharibacteria bacterium]
MSDIDFEELDRAVNSLMEKRGEKMAAKEEPATPAAPPSAPVDSTAPAAVPAEPVTPAPAPTVVADDQTVSNSSAPEPVAPVATEPVVPPVEVVHDTTAPAEASTVPAAVTDATAVVAPAEPVTPAPVEMPATSPAPVSEPAPAAAASGFPTEAPAAEPETATEKEPVGADVSPAPGEAVETPTPETASPAPTISKKPTGRFMDVVHPSSDMKTQRPAVSRTATIQPLSSGYMAPSGAVGGQQSVNDASNGEEISAGSMPADDVTTPPSGEQEPVRRRPARLVIEPDPAHVAEGLTEENLSLDVKDLPDYESIAGEAEGATDSEFVEEGLKLDDFPVDSFDEAAFAAEMSESSLEMPAAEAASAQDTDESANTAMAAETTSLAPEAVAHEVAESEKPAEPEAREEEVTLSTEPSLPEEPPVAVESADAGVADTSAATDVDIATPPKRPLEPELDAELLAIEATETVAPLPPADTAKPETGDVPQQYQAADDIAPQPEPMFDAAASQPAAEELEHKEKKSSGWGVFFLIILCALVGVAGGVAAHFFLLQ